jgi:peptidoglycan-associated lipoprotein
LPPSPTGYGFDQYQTGPLGDVFYDFDSATLSTEAQEQLKQDAAWLGSNSAKRALIEGHCDSRGTSEYNLALGERRSGTAKEYLVKLGVASSRLETVSYGEERPFDSAQNEEAWAKNRRAHFVVK